MTQYCIVGDAFLCYAVVAITCFCCAIADLVGRFKSGNSIDSILIGWPQTIFYILNIGFGFAGLFGSEALGATKIIELASSNLPLAIVKVTGVALASFISLRTTVTTLVTSGNGKKIEVGPGRLFATLIENVEQRIDQSRMVTASADISSIAPLISPRAVFYVVLPYCFDQTEKDNGDREAISKALEAILTSHGVNISSSERSALMLNHLHKIFGLSVLNAARELVDKAADSSLQEAEPLTVDTISLNELKSTGLELDKMYDQLNAKTKAGGTTK